MRRRRLIALTLIAAIAFAAAIGFGAARVWRARADTSLHATRVQSIAISPDGRRVVTGALGGVIKLWDARDCRPAASRCVRTFGARDFTVTALAFFSDGERVLAGDHAGRLRVWDVDTGALVGDVRCDVLSLDVSPDGQRAVVAAGWEIELCDLARGVKLAALASPCVRRQSVGFSPSGDLILTAREEGVRLLDAKTLDVVRDLGCKSDDPDVARISVAFSPDGARVVVGDKREHAGRLQIFDTRDARLVANELAIPLGIPHLVAFTADGRRVIFETGAGPFVWDLELGGTRAASPLPVETFTPCASDGRVVVTVSSTGRGDETELGVRVFAIPPAR